MDKFVARLEREPAMSEIHSLSAVKAHLDSVLHRYVTSVEKYKQNEMMLDIKMFTGIGYIVLCGVLMLLSMSFEYEKYKVPAIVIVVLFWSISYMESILDKFIFHYTFSGTNSKNEEVRITTKLDSPNTVYTILMYFGKKQIPNKVSVCITDLYDDKHHLDGKKYANIIKDGIYGSM